MFAPLPTRPPTPGEYAVLAVFASFLLVLLGIVTLTLGYLAPPEKQEVAAEAIRYGAISLGLGIFIAVAFGIIRRITR